MDVGDSSNYILNVVSQTNVDVLEQYVKKSTSAFHKSHEFCIFFQSTGVDGNPLPDAFYAEQLMHTLMNEKVVNGHRARVVMVNEKNEDIEQVLQLMSSSYVVLAIFSESALRTFSDERHAFKQSNYLLLLQIALKLHDACGVRLLGLNLQEVSDCEGVPALVKFQGWCVQFQDVPHHSEWIQDSIFKTMKRIFAIQGTNIDLEDWEFRVPSLFASLYAAQDDINASGWQSILKIVPWRSILGIFAVFIFCFFCPCGYCIVHAYRKCSKKSQQHKDSIFNVSLFSNGLSLLLVGTLFLGFAVFFSVSGALCSSELKCEVMVRSGSRWSQWRDIASDCQRSGESSCYYLPAEIWQQDFSASCAICVCSHLRANDIEFALKTCGSEGLAQTFLGIGLAVFIAAIAQIIISVKKLQKQALVTKREVKIRSPNENGKAAAIEMKQLIQNNGV